MIKITKLGKNYTQTIEKLQKIGINTYEDLVKNKPQDLTKKINIGTGTAENIIKIANKSLEKEEMKKQISDLVLPDPNMTNTPDKWTISTIYEKIQNGTLKVPKDFQREEFWPEEQKQDLIDSIAIGMTIPPIYVYWNEKQNCHEIIDGQQRTSAERDMMSGELSFMFTSPQACQQHLDVLNGFTINDIYERNKRMYNQLVSRQLDVVVLSGVSREEVQDFYITLNASNSDMSNGELYYAIRGAFHSVLLKIRKHEIFSHIRHSKRRGDLEAVTNLLYMKYNEGYKLKQYKRNKNRTLTQFRKISYKSAENLLKEFTSDLDWCYNIMCHVNYGNSSGATVNLISVLLSIKEDNPELDSENMIKCLDYIFSRLDANMMYPVGFETDFKNIRDHHTNSSENAIFKCWKAIERIFNKGEDKWLNAQSINILEELMRN